MEIKKYFLKFQKTVKNKKFEKSKNLKKFKISKKNR